MSIDGWLTPEEKGYLGRLAESASSIIEIGVWKGRSTSVFCQNILLEGRVFGIDNWIGTKAKPYPSGMDLLEEAQDNLFPFLEAGILTLITGDSIRIAEMFTSQVDLIYIDGCHEYVSVFKDIQSWKDKIRPKGLMCGHDLHEPGVKQAVEELLPDYQKGSGSLWVWRKPKDE